MIGMFLIYLFFTIIATLVKIFLTLLLLLWDMWLNILYLTVFLLILQAFLIFVVSVSDPGIINEENIEEI